MLKRILGIVTFSCLRITEMVESKEATNLSFWEGVRYKTHLAFCKVCRSYEKQSRLIGQALSRMMSSPPKDLKSMDATTKKKIMDKIKRSEN